MGATESIPSGGVCQDAPLSRRRFLIGLWTVGALPVLAACGAAIAPTAAPAATVAPAAPATARTPAGAPARPVITATATGGLRLVPLESVALGAPAVPAGAASTAARAVPYAPAVALYDAYGTDAAPGVFPRTIRHAIGTTTLQAPPTRVLPLDSGELDTVVQLGLKPAGYLNYDPTSMPDYLVAALQGVPTVGTLAEPSLEKIAAIGPDLMLSSKLRHEKLAADLAKIGPVVFGERTGLVWKQNFALYARALGREVEADAAVRTYEERVRTLNAALPAPRPTVSVIRVLNNNLRYYQRANYSGTILSDLGFPRPASQNVDDFALLNQGLETLGPLGDAEMVVVTFTEGPNGTFAREMQASPLWQSLGAVRRGAVFVGSDDIWMAGIGYRSAAVILDDLARFFKLS